MHLKSSTNFDWKRKEVIQYNQNNKTVFLSKSENVTFWKNVANFYFSIYFFVIYDQIMSSLDALSNYVLCHILVPLKEFLDLPFKKNLYWVIWNNSFACFHRPKTLITFLCSQQKKLLTCKAFRQSSTATSIKVSLKNLQKKLYW